MTAEYFQQFKNELVDNDIIFSYCGYFTNDVIASMGDMLKQKMGLEDTDTNTSKKVFYIFVEQLQNIARYSAEWVPDNTEDGAAVLRRGVCAIGLQDGKYIVMSGNLVPIAEAERLKNRLSELNGLDKEQLKVLYKQKLNDGPDAGSKGASIGFIEIARKSSAPLEFSFVPEDEFFSFFYMKAFV